MTTHQIDYAQLATQLESLGQKGASDSLLKNNDVRKRLLEAVTKVIPAIESQDDLVQRIIHTPLEIMAARTGHKMKLFSKLVSAEAPLTTKDIAKTLGTRDGRNIAANEVLLDRVLKFIASLQMIEEVDVGTWGPSRMSRMLVEPGVEGAVYTNFVSLGPTWLKFPDWLESLEYQQPTDRYDTAFSRGHGQKITPWEYYAQSTDANSHFNQFMTVQKFGSSGWLDGFDFEGHVMKGADPSKPIFVDVGGGVGHQCEALLKKFPSLAGRIILQDKDKVIADSVTEDGIEKQVIDFFKEQPVKGARAYYLRSVLHDWEDDLCRKILTIIRAAASEENSLLLLDEMVIPDTRAHKIAMVMDMTMLSNLIAEERSMKRWKELLAEHFEVISDHTYVPEVGSSILVAKPRPLAKPRSVK